MSVTYVIRFNVVPAERERFLSLLNGVLDAMRHEPAFIDAALHQAPENDNVFLLHETWENHQDVMDVQIHRDYRKAYHDALPALLDGDREISMWRRVRTDGAPRG